jgi:hypothetical protein
VYEVESLCSSDTEVLLRLPASQFACELVDALVVAPAWVASTGLEGLSCIADRGPGDGVDSAVLRAALRIRRHRSTDDVVAAARRAAKLWQTSGQYGDGRGPWTV